MVGSLEDPKIRSEIRRSDGAQRRDPVKQRGQLMPLEQAPMRIVDHDIGGPRPRDLQRAIKRFDDWHCCRIGVHLARSRIA
jgi:hypothetical protein